MAKNKDKKLLKTIDIYGYHISINLDNSGDSYKTSIGGITTLLLLSLMIVLFSIDLTSMLEHQNDTINDETIKHDSGNMLSYKSDTNMFMFHSIRKQVGTLPVWFKSDEIKRYVDIFFEQRN